jgi:hypothetical protein
MGVGYICFAIDLSSSLRHHESGALPPDNEMRAARDTRAQARPGAITLAGYSE